MCIIGVIDSGAGGTSTLSALLGVLPHEDFIYVSDRSHAPYGERSADFIFDRMVKICGMLRGLGASAVVIACNTATAATIERLRSDRTIISSQSNPEKKLHENGENNEECCVFSIEPAGKNAIDDMIFVGVEPAIRPAARELTFGKVLVLTTKATTQQDKFAALVRGFDSDKIIISPQPLLAPLIEKNLCDLSAIEGEVSEILLPLATPEIESVVLGCTHYCLIRRQIESIFSGAVKVYDGNMGTAIRLRFLLEQNGLLSRRGDGAVRFIRL